MPTNFESSTTRSLENSSNGNPNPENFKLTAERLKEIVRFTNWSDQNCDFNELKEVVRQLLLPLKSPNRDKENVDLLDTSAKDDSGGLYNLLLILCESVQNLEHEPPKSLFQIVILLYGSFKLIQNGKVKNAIAQICEIWYIKKFVGRSEVVRDIVFYLLERFLIKNQKSDVKRAYKIAAVLLELDLTEEESEILITCSVSSLFINTLEGRRLVTFFLQLNVDFLNVLHGLIKFKLLEYKESEAKFYGEIYYNAWRLSKGEDIQDVIEEKCIQDFMIHCIHANNKRLASTLRKLLGHFHHLKKDKSVESMLFRLYQPILWRSLKVANSDVRANTAVLVFDVFPLIDPAANAVECDNEFQRQLTDVHSLLTDHSPDVREVAIQGICRVCAIYFETITVARVKELLKPLVNTLAFDASSANVRAAVFKGFACFAEAVDTHGVLKEFGRPLGKCLFDVSDKVRVAFLDLLLSLKGRRTIKYWDIALPGDLLFCLEDASPNLARRIVTLLKDAYHPLKATNDVLLERSIALYSDSPTAFRNFYSQLPRILNLKDIVKYILVVNNFLRVYTTGLIKRATEEDGLELVVDANDSNAAEEEDDVFVDLQIEPDIIKALVESVCILWLLSKKELNEKKNSKLDQELVRKFSLSLTRYYKVFKDTIVMNPLIYLSSFIPASKITTAVSYCLSHLKNLPEDCTEQDYSLLLESLCNWNRGDEILELLDVWLKTGLKIEATPAPKKKQRTVRFQDDCAHRPMLAVDMLTFMLKSHTCRHRLLSRSRVGLFSLLAKLKHSQKLLELLVHEQLLPGDLVLSDDYLLRIFFMAFELSLHLHNKNEEPVVDAISYSLQVIVWTENRIVPKLREICATSSESNRGAKLKSSEFAWHISASVVKQLSCALLTNVADMELASRITNFIASILSDDNVTLADESDALLEYIIWTLWRLEEFCLANKEGRSDVCLKILPTLLKLYFKVLGSVAKNDEDRFQNLIKSLKVPVQELLLNYQRFDFLQNTLPELMSDVFELSSTDVARIVFLDSDSLELFDNPESHLTLFFWSCVAKSKTLSKKYLEESIKTLNSEGRDIKCHIAVLFIIYMIQKRDKSHNSIFKDFVLKLEEILNEDHKCHSFELENWKSSLSQMKNSLDML